jgi:hypothetical protein
MLTEKSTPAKAELLAVVCFELMVTSVSRPMTAEGLTTKTLPFPLFVLIATLALPMHDADAVPEQMPVSSQKPLTVSQVVPLARHGVVSAALQATAPWQVCVALPQLELIVQAAPPEEIGPHCTPPVILPLDPLSTHAVGPVE